MQDEPINGCGYCSTCGYGGEGSPHCPHVVRELAHISPPITLHGLALDSDDAMRLNRAALGITADALNEATTFHAYETAAAFLRTSLVDAVSMGASIPDLVRFTDLDADVLLDLLDSTPFPPFSASHGPESC